MDATPLAIDVVNDFIKKNEKFFSFEYFPPKTEKGVEKLKKTLKRMKQWGCQWMDVTWGAGGGTSELTTDICDYIQNTVGMRAMMHLTCTNMPKEKIDIALADAKRLNIRNILALRGDPPKGQKEWKAIETGYSCALDLIKHIKNKYGDFFGITIAGYPEGHPNVRHKIKEANWNPETNNPPYWAPRIDEDGDWEGVSMSDWDAELKYLKQKCDAGGQIIVTQMFFDSQIFIEFVKQARAIGIKAAIVPGIMVIRNFGIMNFIKFCKTVVPDKLKQQLTEANKESAEMVEKVGMTWMVNMCRELLECKDVNIPSVHVYTMNEERYTNVLLTGLKMGNQEILREHALNPLKSPKKAKTNETTTNDKTHPALTLIDEALAVLET